MQWFFPFYVWILAAPSRVCRRWRWAADAPLPDVLETLFPDSSLAVLDAAATHAGNRYRGAGIMVGVLGVLIVLIELLSRLPDAFGRWLPEMGVLKFVLMLLTLGLLAYSWKGRLHDEWIEKRIGAERLRYRHFSAQIDECSRLQGDVAEGGAKTGGRGSDVIWEALVGEAMGNCQRQISYNRERAARYRGIKMFSDDAGWLVFAMALLSTLMEFFVTHPWLLLFTGILPAILVGIHGINGFLGIGSLADEHARMASSLDDTRTKLESAHAEQDRQQLLELAQQLYRLLVTRDTAWMDFARKMELRAN